jgi:hypothetical protein
MKPEPLPQLHPFVLIPILNTAWKALADDRSEFYALTPLGVVRLARNGTPSLPWCVQWTPRGAMPSHVVHSATPTIATTMAAHFFSQLVADAKEVP